MTGLDELQKALEAKAEQESQIRIDLGLQKLPFTDKTQISVNGALEVFSAFQKDKMKRLKVAEEKNEEYAKLVAAQAKEYAEKRKDPFQKKLPLESDELRKALEQKLDRLAEDCHDEIIKSHKRDGSGWAKILSPVIWAWFEREIEPLFSAFQKDKIVLDRKQLIDLMKRQPFPEAFKWIADFKSQYQHWTKKLKELLEGQK